MPLSKHHLDLHTEPVTVDFDRLAKELSAEVPSLVFCVVMGSAACGVVGPRSDLDLACWFEGKQSLDLHLKVVELAERIVPGVRCDLGVLNGAEPVYRYEALKGRLLFARDEDMWVAFFAQTCRAYEWQIADYERQLGYRREAVAGGR